MEKCQAINNSFDQNFLKRNSCQDYIFNRDFSVGMKIVTSEVMREIDTKTIDGGFVDKAMKRAGDEASKEIVRYLSRIHENFKEKLVVLCGKGNNGGDGYVIAKDLHDEVFK